MLFLWFFHAARRGWPRFMMIADHMNYLTFEDPAAVNLVRRALKLAAAGDLYGAAETAGVDVAHAAVVSEGLRRGMRFSIGAEVDNDPRCRPDAQNIVDAMRPDGMIRSIHFLTIPHPETGAEYQWPFDNPEFKHIYDTLGADRVWEIYMETLLDHVAKLPGQIIGHFYVPAKFGHWPSDDRLQRYEDQLLEACAAHGKAIELNTRPVYRGDDPAQAARYRAAYVRLLVKAKEKGVGISVGADAHSPKDQGAAFEWALELLDEADVNEIVFPIDGRLLRVALRMTKELLEQQAAAEAPPPVAASPNGARPHEVAPPEEAELVAAAPAPAAKKRAKAAAVTAAHEPAAAASPPPKAAKPARPAKAAMNGKSAEPTASSVKSEAPKAVAQPKAAAQPKAPKPPVPAKAPAVKAAAAKPERAKAVKAAVSPPKRAAAEKPPAPTRKAVAKPAAAPKAAAAKRAPVKKAAPSRAATKAVKAQPAKKVARPAARPAAPSTKKAARPAAKAARPKAGAKPAPAAKRPAAGGKKGPGHTGAPPTKKAAVKKKSSPKTRR